MGKYQIKFSKKATKSYKKLPQTYKALIDDELLKFESGELVDIKQVVSKEKCYRIRVGKYRILLMIIDEIVIVTDIGTRGDIYK